MCDLSFIFRGINLHKVFSTLIYLLKNYSIFKIIGNSSKSIFRFIIPSIQIEVLQYHKSIRIENLDCNRTNHDFNKNYTLYSCCKLLILNCYDLYNRLIFGCFIVFFN